MDVKILMKVDRVPAQGSSSADELERLYRAGFHEYLRVAEAIAGRDSGLDSVQEGFARAYRYLPDFRGESSLSTWVWTCVVNAAKTARPHSNTAVTEEIPELATRDEDQSPVLRRLISSLPERQRIALFLRYYADLDYRAIAEVLSVEIGTVGAILNRAHSTLRERIEEDSI
jgi:RNA polymerase sigma-70 factor (ECF subfamily)